MKKYLFIFALAIVGGMFGSLVSRDMASTVAYAATVARTTITNPWTFQATTTMNSNLIVTTTNAATSTVSLGCIQTTATSTATPVKLVLSSIATSSVGYGQTTTALVGWTYGYCPKLP